MRLRALFRSHGGIEAEYHLRKKGLDLEIHGTSHARDDSGEPILSTRVVLRPGQGIQSLRVRCCGRIRLLVREPSPQTGASGAQVSP